MTTQPADVEIRDATPGEYAAIGQVAVAAYAEFGSPGDRDWAAYLALLADVPDRAARTVVSVARVGGMVVGTVTLELEGTIGDELVALPAETASMRMLAVAPAARGLGIGRRLTEAAIERCRAAKKRWLILETSEEQRVATALYRSMGFEHDPGRAEDGHAAYRLALM
jgi:ribosomal protein S18 acetylase RimI-like enzyme